MKKLACALCLLITVSSQAQLALHGLFTPIHLQKDTTLIVLDDYFPGEQPTLDKIPVGIVVTRTTDGNLLITGKMDRKLNTLGFKTERRGIRSLLLINPSFKTVEISVPANKTIHGEVRIIGAFNNWNRGSDLLTKKDGRYSAKYDLNPGHYEYKLFVNGEEYLDPSNSETVSNGMGGFNNVITVKSIGSVNAYSAAAIDGDTVVLSRVYSDQIVLGFWNNTPLRLEDQKKGVMASYRLPIPEKAKTIKRSYLRAYSYRGEQMANDLIIPLEYGKPVLNAEKLDRSDWHQARLYFLMVDRFNNGNSENDKPVADKKIHPKANYMGGDLKGVDLKVKDEFFENLNVNTIWLSPITQNPEDAWGYWNKGKTKSKFSGYHGYWPISNVKIDYRFGNKEELNALLENSHHSDKNVILDYVANHVHIDHPIYQKNKSWATDLYLPDGSKNTEKWDEHRLTTWFDDHLPTLDLRRKEVVDPMVDSALFWLTEFEFDGFRHDATKHIDELYWRTLTKKIKASTRKPIYQIGETYGSPQLINSYISTGMLDAQFDFNLYDAAVSAFAKPDGNLEDLKNKFYQSLNTYGYHHLMGNITGNQDRSRFISLASGDVKFEEDQKLAGWDRKIGKPSSKAYRRLALLHAFNNAVPGIPCIYYGDEFGMPGGGDPDNRRMMKFENYDADEQKLLDQVTVLNELRATELPLLFGTTKMEVQNGAIMIHRSYFNQEVVILINPSSERKAAEWSASDSTSFKNTFLSNAPQYDGVRRKAVMALPPLSFEYLIKTTKP